MLTKILKNLILITVLIQFSLLEPSQQHEGLYFEDNFDEATLYDGNYFVIGVRFVNFFNALDYKPNPLTDETLTLTDITSITSQTVDNETCVIPFEYNDVLNYFCVPNTPEDTLLCGDSSGNFSECAFGQLMAVRPARGINAFSTQFQFADPFQFKSNLFYTFEFNYLLNYDVCDNDSLQLEIALYDRDSTKQVLFDLSTNEYPNENNRWNTFSTCFHGLDDDFYLMITASNICDNSMVFVALDNIIVRQTNGDHLEETCQNFRVTSENHAESTISSLELTTSKESIYPTEEIVTSTSKSETTSKSNIESTLLVDLTSKIWTSDLPTSASTPTSSSTHSATPEITTTTATTTKTTSTITEEESNETDLLFIVTIISGVSLVLVVVLFVVVFIFGCCIIKKLNYKKVSPTRNFEMS